VTEQSVSRITAARTDAAEERETNSASSVVKISPAVDTVADRTLEIDLRDYIVREMLIAFGRAPDGVALRILGPSLRIPATRFARLIAGTDAVVGRSTMTAGAQWLLSRLVTGVEVRGAETIPMAGPLLVASNHPGAYDSVAIIASLPPREDLMVLASDVPFLRRVPNIGAHTIYVSPDPHARMGAIRAMIRHLEAGGAVMTFGSGLVDPDPDLLPGAAEALEIWYESLAIALRRVPQTEVVVSIVSSVVAPQYMRSPLTRLKQDGWERRKLAEFLQIGSQLLLSKRAPLTPRVSFSQPITAADLPAERGQPITMRPIIERAKGLLAEHMAAAPRNAAQ
jgi:hypothetical protein